MSARYPPPLDTPRTYTVTKFTAAIESGVTTRTPIYHVPFRTYPIMPKVRLIPQSTDGETVKTFEIDIEVAKQQSGLIAKMLEDDDDCEDVVHIPLPEVTPDILALVVKFMEHNHSNPMKEIEKPINTHDISKIVGEWDAEFIGNANSGPNHIQIYTLMLAANYLDIKSLLDLAVCRIVCTIKEHVNDTDKLKELFGIEGDITPEEERKIREDNAWIFDIDVNKKTTT